MTNTNASRILLTTHVSSLYLSHTYLSIGIVLLPSHDRLIKATGDTEAGKEKLYDRSQHETTHHWTHGCEGRSIVGSNPDSYLRTNSTVQKKYELHMVYFFVYKTMIIRFNT